ncbi:MULTISPECIES: DUF924 family protein [Brucella/Ochrobactrum group]|uniref:DUF924 family protein n=1 Tax=Brucella/Ochrobactrum group TaxID=2826938 RepID=UPI00124E3F79|nr:MULTISPECIES: DUF924 family protein [Brucella/Ochrobactrum group]KAB2689874.1 DUF924 family protein [Brucella intermedia]NKE75544.1 DUF924 family protein [Ochrobactrum sp. MC-1LL]
MTTNPRKQQHRHARQISHAVDFWKQAGGLNAKLGDPWHSHVQGHRDIIQRIRRFSHRNPMLGRETADEEGIFLREGGFKGYKLRSSTNKRPLNGRTMPAHKTLAKIAETSTLPN